MLYSYGSMLQTHLQRLSSSFLCNSFTVHDIPRILSNCIPTLHLFLLMPFAISSLAGMDSLNKTIGRDSLYKCKMQKVHIRIRPSCVSICFSLSKFLFIYNFYQIYDGIVRGYICFRYTVLRKTLTRSLG